MTTRAHAKVLLQQLYMRVNTLLKEDACVWVAYSGGRDSHVLLHACHQLWKQQAWKQPLRAIHVNHQINPNATTWQQHVQKVCDDLHIPLLAQKANLDRKPGKSLEQCARSARYNAFKQHLKPQDLLLLAHHQADQAETLLLRLMRGTGSHGLAGIPLQRPCGGGTLVRPLLHTSVTSIAEYADTHNLNWVEDPSNANTAIDRNYIRHEIIPKLQARWPHATQSISKTAQLCKETTTLLDTHAQQNLDELLKSPPHTLDIQQLVRLPEPEQNNVLRLWLRLNGKAPPQLKQLEQLKHNIVEAKQDATPVAAWSGMRIRRYQRRLYLLPEEAGAEHTKDIELSWDWQLPLQLPTNDILYIRASGKSIGINPDSLPNNLRVTYRQGGERLRPYKRQGSHPLKKLFQEWGVPPWERQSIPLIYDNHTLICVVGYAIAHDYAEKSTKAVTFALQ